MDRNFISACLHKLEETGIKTDERLVRIFSERQFRNNTKVVVLLLDGQEDSQKGRFASFTVDSSLNILSFNAFERLGLLSARLIANSINIVVANPNRII